MLKKENQKKLTNKKKKNIYYKIILILLLLIIIILFKILFPKMFTLKWFSHIFPSYFINRKSSPNISICLCVIAKMENLYAKEYVNHYKKLGYKHIYIYDNNDLDGEKFEMLSKMKSIQALLL